jgi:hypothetical protein
MKNISLGIIFLLVSFFTKWVLWDLNISSGKLIGTVQQISQTGKVPFLKNWEGTLKEVGNSNKEIPFSVKDNRIGVELLRLEGKPVTLYFNQSLISWPRKTDISVTEWRLFQKNDTGPNKSDIISLFQKTLFCSFLGSLINNRELYQQVKDYIKIQNIYLYNQYQKCNN